MLMSKYTLFVTFYWRSAAFSSGLLVLLPAAGPAGAWPPSAWASRAEQILPLDLSVSHKEPPSEARCTVEAGLEMGNGEEEGLPRRSEAVANGPAVPKDAGVREEPWPTASSPRGPSGLRAASPTTRRGGAAASMYRRDPRRLGFVTGLRTGGVESI